MTAKEYLKSQLGDPHVEYSSPQTKRGLAEYALRIKDGVDGYSIEDAEHIIRSFIKDDEFVEKCKSYISNCTEFLNIIEKDFSFIED